MPTTKEERISFSINTEKTDVRRKKHYWREISAGMSGWDIPWYGAHEDLKYSDFDPRYQFRKKNGTWSEKHLKIRLFLHEFFEDRLGERPTSTNVRVDWSRSGSGKNTLQGIYVQYRFEADKPSEIISKEEAIEKLGGEEKIAQTMRSALAHILWERHRTANLSAKYRAANWLGEQCIAQVTDKAMEEARYDQRLVALRAELDKEIEIQKEKLSDTLREEALEAGFEEEIVEHVLEILKTKTIKKPGTFRTVSAAIDKDGFEEHFRHDTTMKETS